MRSSSLAATQPPAVRDLGSLLRVAFAEVEAQALPPEFEALLARLGSDEPPRERAAALSDAAFKAELTGVVPHLRAFSRSLSGGRDIADDLVQETLLKAWAARARFQAGTSIRAWTFIILRNLFLSQMRRNRFKGEWDDFTADRLLAMPASQTSEIDLADVQRGLQQLPEAQREALILVGAGGMAYEEAAQICNCAVGTIKSRVARGRTALAHILNEGLLPPRVRGPAPHSPIQTILRQVDVLSEG